MEVINKRTVNCLHQCLGIDEKVGVDSLDDRVNMLYAFANNLSQNISYHNMTEDIAKRFGTDIVELFKKNYSNTCKSPYLLPMFV